MEFFISYITIDTHEITSVTGELYIGFDHEYKTVYVPSEIARTMPQVVQDRFRQSGVHLIGKDGVHDIVKSMRHFGPTPEIKLLSKLGWNKNYFIRPDGQLFGATNADTIVIAPETSAGICRTNGMLEQWQRDVASAVCNDCIPAMAILAQFAAPILSLTDARHVLAFEVVESSGSSIGCITHLMSSVNGGLGPRVGERYAVTFGDLVADPFRHLAARSDAPMIIDGHSMHMLGMSHTKRLEDVKALLSRKRPVRASDQA